ncbi:MAG: TrmH family RNA methyltransferase [Acidimicrobiales bacterium]
MGFAHQRVRRLRRLLQKRALRWSERAFVAEGVEVVTCGLDSGRIPEAIFVDAAAHRSRDVTALCDAARSGGARVHMLAPGVADRVADTVTPHPVFGIFAMTDVALADVAVPTLAVVCIDVRDPGNAGTVLRTCDAAGVDVVVCVAGTVDPFNAKTVRSSAGSIFHVPVVVAAELDPVLAWLRERGLAVYGTASVGTDYRDLELSLPSAFVLGNESAGLDPELLGSLDGTAAIPMAGRAESLNVGVASAVLCFEAQRQRRSEPPPG